MKYSCDRRRTVSSCPLPAAPGAPARGRHRHNFFRPRGWAVAQATWRVLPLGVMPPGLIFAALYRPIIGWAGPAWGAGRVLVGAAGAPKHGLDGLDAAYVRRVRRWTVPKSVP